MSLTSVQTTITNEPTLGAPGMLYDSEENDTVSCRATEAIPFGAYVKILGGECELADSSAEVTAEDGGVALHTQNKPSVTGGGYAAGDIVGVLRRGRVWVTTEEAIANGVQPFIRFTTDGADVQGGWRNDADTARAVQKPGVTMYRGNGAAGLAVVQLSGHRI